MSIRQLGKRLESRIHQINRVLSWVSIVVLFAMMLLQTVDVIARYVFNSPLTATMDVIEVMMAILVFWSLPYTASINEHVRVDVLTVHLPKRVQENLDRITFLAGAFILALITWRLGFRAWSIIQNPPGPVTLTLLVPYWPFILAATFGCFMFFLESLIRVFNPNSGKTVTAASEIESLAKTDNKDLAGST